MNRYTICVILSAILGVTGSVLFMTVRNKFVECLGIAMATSCSKLFLVFVLFHYAHEGSIPVQDLSQKLSSIQSSIRDLRQQVSPQQSSIRDGSQQASSQQSPVHRRSQQVSPQQSSSGTENPSQ